MNTFQFPLIAEAAMNLLAVPDSEVDVECLFCGYRAVMSGELNEGSFALFLYLLTLILDEMLFI